MVRYIVYWGANRQRILYDSASNSDSQSLISAIVKQKTNSAFTFDYEVTQDNELFDRINDSTKRITVVRIIGGVEECLFSGYPSSVEYDSNNICSVSCDGILSRTAGVVFDYYLKTGSPTAVLTDILSSFNKAWFRASGQSLLGLITVGNVTVTAPTGNVTVSKSGQCTAWECLKLLQASLGGYLIPRYNATDDTVILDWLSAPSETCQQSIKAGVNLIDIKTEISHADKYTGVYPVGKSAGSALTLPKKSTATAESDGTYLYGRAVFSNATDARKSTKVQVISYDGISNTDDLKTAAKADLAQLTSPARKTKISAADIGYISDVPPFKLFSYVNVDSDVHAQYHLTNEAYIITALDIDILSPADSKVSVDSQDSSITQQTTSAADGTDRTGTGSASDTRTYYSPGDVIQMSEYFLIGVCLFDTKKVRVSIPLTMPIRANSAIVSCLCFPFVDGQHSHGSSESQRVVPTVTAAFSPVGLECTFTFDESTNAEQYKPCVLDAIITVMFQ